MNKESVSTVSSSVTLMNIGMKTLIIYIGIDSLQLSNAKIHFSFLSHNTSFSTVKAKIYSRKKISILPLKPELSPSIITALRRKEFHVLTAPFQQHGDEIIFENPN